MPILKEPLLHFAVLGIAIFAGYSLIVDDDGVGSIVVSSGQQANLIATFERTWQRPPTAQEFSGLLEDFIRQEIAYREAGRMQLDRDDIVIRRRLQQKLELLTEDLASLAPPTEAELDAWYGEHAESYRTVPRYSFEQALVATERGDSAREAALMALADLKSGSASADAIDAQAIVSLPPRMRDVPHYEVAALFGTAFAASLATLPIGEWTGPVDSGFGLHLVMVSHRLESRIPPLADVERAVRTDFLNDRRRSAVEMLYERLGENYTITIEPLGSAQE